MCALIATGCALPRSTSSLQNNTHFTQVPHQDSTFLYTDPPSCVGLWLALEDATRANGCLWGLKGIHKQGLARRFKRLPQGGVGFDGPAPTYDLSGFEPIECAAGTLVLLHGANVHYR